MQIKYSTFLSFLFLLLLSCTESIDNKTNSNYLSTALTVKVSAIIDAVNQKNADQYVKDFAEDVQVFVEAELKVNGKESLLANRTKHFEHHPNVRSEIQHLVEIDNKVILHDKVWLNDSNSPGKDIVEIFTFENGLIKKVEVIQPKDLFE